MKFCNAAITKTSTIITFKLLVMKNARFHASFQDIIQTGQWEIHQVNWAIFVYGLPRQMTSFTLNTRTTGFHPIILRSHLTTHFGAKIKPVNDKNDFCFNVEYKINIELS